MLFTQKNREAFYVLGGPANDFGIRWQMAWIGCFSFFSFHRNSTFSFFYHFSYCFAWGFLLRLLSKPLAFDSTLYPPG